MEALCTKHNIYKNTAQPNESIKFNENQQLVKQGVLDSINSVTPEEAIKEQVISILSRSGKSHILLRLSVCFHNQEKASAWLPTSKGADTSFQCALTLGTLLSTSSRSTSTTS